MYVVYNDVMEKKTEYFYMRMNKSQKKTVKEAAQRLNMTMTQYFWHLVVKDNKND